MIPHCLREGRERWRSVCVGVGVHVRACVCGCGCGCVCVGVFIGLKCIAQSLQVITQTLLVQDKTSDMFVCT